MGQLLSFAAAGRRSTDASFTSSSEHNLRENTELMWSEVGFDCWESKAERKQIVVSDPISIASELPQVDMGLLKAAAGYGWDKSKKKQREAQYEEPLKRLLAAWVAHEQPSIDGRYAVHVGACALEQWETNMRKCHRDDTKPDIQVYVDGGNNSAVQVGLIEVKSGNGSSRESDMLDRSAIQQAVVYALVFQRPTMSKMENGMKRFRLPALVIFEDCAYWISLTSDDAIEYPYTIDVRKYAFESLDRYEAAVRVCVAYVRSLVTPGLYEFDKGFTLDASQLFLPTQQLKFPGVCDCRVERTEWANNIFRCDMAVFQLRNCKYFKKTLFENEILKTGQVASQSVVIKVVSSTCYNMQNSANHLFAFLDKLKQVVRDQKLKQENAALRSALANQDQPIGDRAVNELTSRVDQLRVSGDGDAGHKPTVFQSIYNTYLWIGGRGKRAFGKDAGMLVVTANLGEPILSSDFSDMLKTLFSSSGARLRDAFFQQVCHCAFAVVTYAGFCHLDIRPPNLVVLNANNVDTIQFSIIDWEEVLPIGFLNDRVRHIGDDGWYPSVRLIEEATHQAIVYTACQLFLCMFVMRCSIMGATSVESSVRSIMGLWNNVQSINEFVEDDLDGKEKQLSDATVQFYKYLQSILSGSISVPEFETIVKELRRYLDDCAFSTIKVYIRLSYPCT